MVGNISWKETDTTDKHKKIIVEFVKHVSLCGKKHNVLHAEDYQGTNSPYKKIKHQQIDETMASMSHVFYMD